MMSMFRWPRMKIKMAAARRLHSMMMFWLSLAMIISSPAVSSAFSSNLATPNITSSLILANQQNHIHNHNMNRTIRKNPIRNLLQSIRLSTIKNGKAGLNPTKRFDWSIRKSLLQQHHQFAQEQQQQQQQLIADWMNQQESEPTRYFYYPQFDYQNNQFHPNQNVYSPLGANTPVNGAIGSMVTGPMIPTPTIRYPAMIQSPPTMPSLAQSPLPPQPMMILNHPNLYSLAPQQPQPQSQTSSSQPSGMFPVPGHPGMIQAPTMMMMASNDHQHGHHMMSQQQQQHQQSQPESSSDQDDLLPMPAGNVATMAAPYPVQNPSEPNGQETQQQVVGTANDDSNSGYYQQTSPDGAGGPSTTSSSASAPPLGIILGRPMTGYDGHFYVPVFYPSSWVMQSSRSAELSSESNNYRTSVPAVSAQQSSPATPLPLYQYNVPTPNFQYFYHNSEAPSTTNHGSSEQTYNPLLMSYNNDHDRQYPPPPEHQFPLFESFIGQTLDATNQNNDRRDLTWILSQLGQSLTQSTTDESNNNGDLEGEESSNMVKHQGLRKRFKLGKLRPQFAGATPSPTSNDNHIGGGGNSLPKIESGSEQIIPYHPYPLEHIGGDFYVGPPVIRIQDPEAELKLALEATSRAQMEAEKRFATEILMINPERNGLNEIDTGSTSNNVSLGSNEYFHRSSQMNTRNRKSLVTPTRRPQQLSITIPPYNSTMINVHLVTKAGSLLDNGKGAKQKEINGTKSLMKINSDRNETMPMIFSKTQRSGGEQSTKATMNSSSSGSNSTLRSAKYSMSSSSSSLSSGPSLVSSMVQSWAQQRSSELPSMKTTVFRFPI